MIRYLALGSDGSVGGYERADILLCDIAEHRRDGDEVKALWKRDEDSLATRFIPTTEDELREIELADRRTYEEAMAYQERL